MTSPELAMLAAKICKAFADQGLPALLDVDPPKTDAARPSVSVPAKGAPEQGRPATPP
jgi:hypothetical protein